MIQAGDKIKFGKYKWRALIMKNNAALFITEDIIELRAFHTSSGNVTCSICEFSHNIMPSK